MRSDRNIVIERAEGVTGALLNASFMFEKGIITHNNMARVFYRNVVRKWKSKVFEEKIPTKMNSLYFDSKKDKTKQSDGRLVVEDHVTIISEPGVNFYIM